MPVYNRFDVGAPLPAGEYMPLAAFDIPVTDGLAGSFFMASGKSIANQNTVTTDDSWMQGNIMVEDGAIRFGDNAYMDTGLAETQAATVLIICRKPVATDSVGFFGNYSGNSAPGLALYSGTSGASSMSVAVQKVSGMITAAIGADLMDWTMIAVSVPATGQVRVHNLTSGTAANHANTEARAAPNVQKMWVGALPTDNGNNLRKPADVALVLYWSRNLSDAEIDAVGAWARGYAAAQGIVA